MLHVISYSHFRKLRFQAKVRRKSFKYNFSRVFRDQLEFAHIHMLHSYRSFNDSS